MHDCDGLPTSHMKQRARSMHMLMHHNQEGGSMLDNTTKGRAELHKAMGKSLVQCYLNVTSVLSCKDGLVCVAVSCGRKDAKNAGKDVKNIYVAPQDLIMPEDDKQWDEALSYILV
jgi:hypothetical protein